MLAPALETIRATAVEQFLHAVHDDEDGSAYSDLLDVEEQAADFARTLERDIVQRACSDDLGVLD